MDILINHGDLLDQEVDVIVNTWNRNIIPWWLLLPQGVSGAIKRKGGYAPFRELAKNGPMPAGSAVLTGSGKLHHKGIVHVAGINMFWCSSETIIRQCVCNALDLAETHQFTSIAFPLIGKGTGGFPPERAKTIMLDQMKQSNFSGRITLVIFTPR